VIGRSDFLCIAIACAAAALLLAGLWTTGLLAGATAPDTASYFLPLQSGQPWSEMRHPLYGFLAQALGGVGNAHVIALAQAAFHVLAALLLYGGARAGGIGATGALALTLAALFSQSGIYHLRLILPESPAISALIVAFAGTLAATKSGAAFRLLILPVALAAGCAYLLRPSFLPAIVVLPALWYLLARRNAGGIADAWRAVLLLALIAAPFAVQSAYRWQTVGDFNIVSFGGFSMSGLAGFMLTPELIPALPEPIRPTAQAVLAAREAGEAAGLVERTPLNSLGVRSFVSAALGYFDIYARSYDNLVWGEIIKLRGPSESWVAFNERLQAFAVATVVASPVRWAAWIAGATSRLAGRMIVTNLPMVAALVVLAVVALVAFARQTAPAAGGDVAATCFVALAWLACTAPLIVLTTFPATRYIDTGAVLLPAVPAALVLALIHGMRRSPPAGASGAVPR